MTPDAIREPERLVVGIDGSLCSHTAVRWALEHARPGDTVTLVHAWFASPSLVNAGLVDPTDDRAARGFAEHEFARARSTTHGADIRVLSEVVHGDAGRCLASHPADLLVVGACGHGGLTRILLGSVSAYLAGHCPIPLVIVPHPGKPSLSPRNGGTR